MADQLFLVISPDGIAAGHPDRVKLPVLVAPSTADERNTLQPQLIAVACALVPDHHFEFDSSFVMPDAAKAFSKLVDVVKAFPGCPLSVFGHADPVGLDDYNKQLSGRRARAVYGLLIRDVEMWEKLFRPAYGGDNWGTKSIQVMLTALGHYEGPLNGVLDAKTKEAVRSFQQSPEGAGLFLDGDPGKETRRALYKAYMDLLCRDGSGNVFTFSKTDFLARGDDPKGKGDYQGCGEFNPSLIFSETEHQDFERAQDKKPRNEANAPNRRVLVFLFQRGTRINFKFWPCPRAEEGDAGCQLRFWSDGKQRRSLRLPDERREFKETEDTFACRFYHGIAFNSPCETTLKMWVLRILEPGTGPIDKRKPLANKPFMVVAGDTPDAPELKGTTDANGFLRIPVLDDIVTMTLRIDGRTLFRTGEAPADSESEKETAPHLLTFTLKGGDLIKVDEAGEDPIKQRLYNLGYGKSQLADWTADDLRRAITRFQKDHSLDENGTVDDPTRDKLKAMHGS